MDTAGITHSVDLTTDTQAKPAAVWAVLTDIDSAAQTLSGVDRVERIDGPRYGVATRWRETRTMFGKAVTEEMWVAEVNEGSRTVIEAESSGLQYSTTFTLEPVDSGTRVAMNFSCHMPYPRGLGGFMFKRSGKMWVKATSRTMQKDLDDIARAAERRADS